MNSIKTQKGTSLPLMTLKGKDYLEVKYRLIWFHEQLPNWCITSEIIKQDETMAVMKCTIFDDAGKIRSSAHKMEHRAHFADFLEKAETGATGRALANLGFGTQFAPELEEGDRVVDSPVTPKPRPPWTPPPEAKKADVKNHAPQTTKPNVTGGKLTSEQVVKLFKEAEKNRWSGQDVKNYVESVLKKKVEELTNGEAYQVMDMVKQMTFQELLKGQVPR